MAEDDLLPPAAAPIGWADAQSICCEATVKELVPLNPFRLKLTGTELPALLTLLEGGLAMGSKNPVNV